MRTEDAQTEERRDIDSDAMPFLTQGLFVFPLQRLRSSAPSSTLGIEADESTGICTLCLALSFCDWEWERKLEVQERGGERRMAQAVRFLWYSDRSSTLPDGTVDGSVHAFYIAVHPNKRGSRKRGQARSSSSAH